MGKLETLNVTLYRFEIESKVRQVISPAILVAVCKKLPSGSRREACTKKLFKRPFVSVALFFCF